MFSFFLVKSELELSALVFMSFLLYFRGFLTLYLISNLCSDLKMRKRIYSPAHFRDLYSVRVQTHKIILSYAVH